MYSNPAKIAEAPCELITVVAVAPRVETFDTVLITLPSMGSFATQVPSESVVDSVQLVQFVAVSEQVTQGLEQASTDYLKNFY